MAMQTGHDIPLLITSDNTHSERRITPSWSISLLKSKLEPVTGIPPLSQKLVLKVANQQGVSIEALDEENTLLSTFPLAPYAELHSFDMYMPKARSFATVGFYLPYLYARTEVSWKLQFSTILEGSKSTDSYQITDTRPVGARLNINDTSGVEKYVMPVDEYEKKSDSVLAWKKSHQLGRFDPNAPSLEAAKIANSFREVSSRKIEVGARCRVGGEDEKRGTVMYIGEVEEIAKTSGGIGAWVGVKLDEPVGKNDGSLGGKRYWEGPEGGPKNGVFVRPERVEVGDWPVLDDLEDMEEI